MRHKIVSICSWVLIILSIVLFLFFKDVSFIRTFFPIVFFACAWGEVRVIGYYNEVISAIYDEFSEIVDEEVMKFLEDAVCKIEAENGEKDER